jgi:hypothetical protein
MIFPFRLLFLDDGLVKEPPWAAPEKILQAAAAACTQVMPFVTDPCSFYDIHAGIARGS